MGGLTGDAGAVDPGRGQYRCLVRFDHHGRMVHILSERKHPHPLDLRCDLTKALVRRPSAREPLRAIRRSPWFTMMRCLTTARVEAVHARV